MKKRHTKNIQFNIITAVPKGLVSYLGESLLKRAREKGIVNINLVNLRQFSASRHKKIDDRPFGGGPGMVLQIEPIWRAVQFVKSKISAKGAAPAKSGGQESASGGKNKKVWTILFSTRGKKLDAKTAKRLSRYNTLILICGRYEGVDERVQEHIADEEISIGDYVLSGGELPALVMIEAVARFIPGFLGKEESLEEVKGSYPVYTRPAVFKPRGAKRAWAVPRVLLSGDHKKIEQWREGT